MFVSTQRWQILAIVPITSSINFIDNIAEEKLTVKCQICRPLCIRFSLHPLCCNCVISLNSTLRSAVRVQCVKAYAHLCFAWKTCARNRIQGGQHLHEWWVIYAFSWIAGRVNYQAVWDFYTSWIKGYRNSNNARDWAIKSPKNVCHFCYLQDFKESMKQCSAKISGSLEVLEKDLANHLTKILNKEGDSFLFIQSNCSLSFDFSIKMHQLFSCSPEIKF